MRRDTVMGAMLLLACTGVTAGESADRILRTTMVLDAPPAEVWALWTTEPGLASFLAPAARVEPRVDGRFEIFFDPAAPEGQRGADGMRILVYETHRRLSFTWNAPADQPYARAQRTVVTIELRPLPQGRTRMTFTHAGWGEGADWDRAYDYFDRAWNAVVLPRLRHRMVNGPVDWTDLPVLEPVASTLKASLVLSAER